MRNLRIDLKSADIESAMEVTKMLYQYVEEEKIPSIKINKIKKGKNSIDVTSLIPLLQNIDFNALFQAATSHPATYIPSIYLSLKIIDKCISIVLKGLELKDELHKKSFLGLHCKIKGQSIVKFGRTFGIPFYDTILTSATQETVDNTLRAKNQWGEIPIAKEKYLMIKYVAIFVKHPIRAVEWIGKVKTIKYNKKNKKSTIVLDGKPQRIRSIPYDKKCPRHNGHGTVYTTRKRILNAKTMCDVYPSLNP